MHPGHLSLTLSNAKDTARYAALLGRTLRPGDVVLLIGDVGAGKTHFARALIQSVIAVPEDVPSPTFTLVQTYETPLCALWHADLYRLSAPEEIEELGLIDAFDDAICLVEWPDRLGPLYPADALDLTLSADVRDNGRRLDARWTNPRWAAKLSVWR